MWVEVSCKVYDPYIESVNPDGFWYRIASQPWDDQYYAAANTFMNGDPWDGPYEHNTDWAVPDCDIAAPPPPPPPPSQVVTLARGDAAPLGYWYIIDLTNFAGLTGVAVTCRDSVDPTGFRTFQLMTDADGSASSRTSCYSGDGPDHWVVADGVESNHVAWTWSAPALPTTPVVPPPPPPTNQRPAPPAPLSVFFSGTDTDTGVDGVRPATHNFGYGVWPEGDCKADHTVVIAQQYGWPSALSGWSKGRLGVVYYLSSASPQSVASVHRIVLFDPGSTADFAKPTGWRSFFTKTCDWRYDINTLLASWLRSDPVNQLFILTGEKSEEKVDDKPTYAGLWHYYLAGMWNQPYADRAHICDYDERGHSDVLEKFAGLVDSTSSTCPSGPNRTVWHP
jgi:hypothetical protein